MSIVDVLKVVKDIPILLSLKKGLRPRPKEDIDSVGLQCSLTATKFPDAIMMRYDNQQLTWREFNQLANRYARALTKVGVGHNDVVSILMENRPEFLALFVAVNKLGAVAALINTNLRTTPLLHCISVTQSKVCVFGTELSEAVDGIRSELHEQTETLIAVADTGNSSIPPWSSDMDQLLQGTTEEDPTSQNEVTLGQVALYIFTSGTTGLPKAAVMTNGRFLRLAKLSSIAGLRCTQRDCMYLCLPMYHSTALVIGFGSAVISGASFFLRRKFSTSKFLEEVRIHKITHLIYVGELLRYLNNVPTQTNDHDSTLHTMMGNGLRPDIWVGFKKRFGIKRITEFYASSEGNVAFANILNKDCTIGLTASKIALVRYDVDSDTVVRDTSGKCVEVVEGEVGLCLGNINPNASFEGYTDPAATEKKVLKDVFEVGDRWFNTGDLMKTVPVGFSLGYTHYQFVDRTGDTFRWYSENVSTNEVAEVLNDFDQIAISNVFGVKVPEAEGRAGMAALTLQEGVEKLDIERFSAHVEQHLPFFARPVFIRILPTLEVTSTFKVIKKDLREEGYDITKIDDRMYVLKKGTQAYVALDQEFYEKILRGETRF